MGYIGEKRQIIARTYEDPFEVPAPAGQDIQPAVTADADAPAPAPASPVPAG